MQPEFQALEGTTQHFSLPVQLYTAQATRLIDQHVIQSLDIPGVVLMKRAGRACFQAILSRWPNVDRITIFCGSGNNGGDGYVIAALAKRRGVEVQLLAMSAPDDLKGDALRACQFAQAEGVSVEQVNEATTVGADMISGEVIVDALLGTGASGKLRDRYAQCVQAINKARALGAKVVAVDLPSGVNADTGAVSDVAVEADLTVTFIGLKLGMFTGRGPALCGEVVFDHLDIPPEAYHVADTTAERLRLPTLLGQLPPRMNDAHKGDFGHVLVVGGDRGYGGAALLAAQASARCGSGLTSLATRSEHVGAAITAHPEVMALGVQSGQELADLLSRPTVLAVGPGLGKSAWSQQLLQAVLKCPLPKVLDADALNLLAETDLLGDADNADFSNVVMTPHPGEAARLLGMSTKDIQADRLSAARQLRRKFGCTVVLKGAGTVVATTDEQLFICTLGNPGMASGGMGDVLTGVIASLLAQGVEQNTAACMATAIHAAAGDLAAEEDGQRGLLARDLIPFIRSLLNGVEYHDSGILVY
ncbi:NAD(P)H-hydrate dehydratase [Marinibactrum halimedae]|uniref:Bifunctional NAD(P)H-hydrate repair enzyme n=1 Tax=Marinibactrum halimedae TaxID=1444977 RepID=A0AA37WM67_9GAMM|nr:NAD(P)H-hydrate dehydratase [Marinibactrum halimedae]MCD9459727.1 NAD(P)H-hydrate dehydratase [Marinibactrum halimedae]GLS24516.1 bifunctional NAD(P)H-hydrate repair enzyme [Marinibactrum halimedae]